jgi:bifunctional non-homologous end joining protein LigD
VVRIDTDREAGTLEIAGVRVTHPERVMFPGERITKRMLIDYYLSVADRILPHVADRPLSLVRFPDGTEGDGFFQKHASPGFPADLKRVRIKEKDKSEDYLYISDERGLVAAAQMGALELHVWGSHVASLEKPDRLVFDFDPDETIDFAAVKNAAKEMRDRLKVLGLTSFAMATGGKGIHVVVPLTPRHGWDDIKAFAEALARTLAAESPDRYLAEMSKKARKGRIFIDYLRNGRGATAIAPFSTRARNGAPIAWPVAWTALGKLASAHTVTVATAPAALRAMKKDPWAGYFDVDQVLPIDRLK